MRKVLVVALIAAALALGLFVPRGSTAPALGDKPVRYEFAELRSNRSHGPAPRQPGQVGPARNVLYTSLKWTTAAEQKDFTDWEDFADKLKAPAPKKDSPFVVHKLRVLNALSADGWEVVEHTDEDAVSVKWSFRRKLP